MLSCYVMSCYHVMLYSLEPFQAGMVHGETQQLLGRIQIKSFCLEDELTQRGPLHLRHFLLIHAFLIERPIDYAVTQTVVYAAGAA